MNGVPFLYQAIQLFEHILCQTRGNLISLYKYFAASGVHGNFRCFSNPLQIAVVFPKELAGHFNIRKINGDWVAV